MKKILSSLFGLLFLLAPIAHASTTVVGQVIYLESGCDYYIVSDEVGYDLLEWYGGHSPSVGDFVVGEIHSFGFKDIYIGTSASSISKGRAWVDDYFLGTDSAVKKFRDKCPLYTSTYTPSTYTPTYTYPTSYTPSYTDYQLSNDNYYTNSYGNSVHSPAYAPVVPSSASAQCSDGTYSFSQSRSGTCSRHGGVATWY